MLTIVYTLWYYLYMFSYGVVINWEMTMSGSFLLFSVGILIYVWAKLNEDD